MSDAAGSDLHRKLLAFLGGEFARQNERSCVKVELLYSQPNCRDEALQTWNRTEQSELFENMALVDKLVADIVEMAEGHADSFGGGTHRFVVKTHQHLGGRVQHAFNIKPAFAAQDASELALAGGGAGRPGGGVDALGVLTTNNQALLRNNTMMFQSSFGTLANIMESTRKENLELRAENTTLKRKLDEAESTKEMKEFEIAMSMEKQKLKSDGVKQLMNFGQIALAKFAGGGDMMAGGSSSGMMMLVRKLRDSITEEQFHALVAGRIFDQSQIALFVEIMNASEQKASPGPKKPGKLSGANGTAQESAEPTG